MSGWLLNDLSCTKCGAIVKDCLTKRGEEPEPDPSEVLADCGSGQGPCGPWQPVLAAERHVKHSSWEVK